MKKSLIVLALLCATAAQAQNYQEMEYRRGVCTGIARMSKLMWSSKQDNQPFPVERITKSRSYPMIMWAYHFVETRALSEDDTLRSVLAMCYDNIEMVDQGDRIGRPIREDQLR